jgi:hypothetical protein
LIKIKSENKPKNITRVERRFWGTVFFFVVASLFFSIIDTVIFFVILPAIEFRVLLLYVVIMEGCIAALLIAHAPFLKKEIEYQIVSEKQTWYGSEVKLERIENLDKGVD